MMTVIVRATRLQKTPVLLVTLHAPFLLNEILSKSQCNWFDVASNTLARYDGEDREAVIKHYCFGILTSEKLDCEQRKLVQQSHDAFVCDREGRLPLAQTQAAAVKLMVILSLILIAVIVNNTLV